VTAEQELTAKLKARLWRAGIKVQAALKLALSRQGRFNFAKGGGRTRGPLGPNTVRSLKDGRQSRYDAKLARTRVFRSVGFSRGTLGKLEGRYNEAGKLLGLVGRSAPGEPPRFQSGRLRNSISLAWLDDLTVRVGTNVKYAKWLEFGTRGGKVIVPKKGKALYDPVSKRFFGKRVVQGAIRPRPFFRPTMQRMRGEISQTLAGAA